MATQSQAEAQSGLPFEDPLQVPSDQLEPIKMASMNLLKLLFSQVPRILSRRLSQVLMN